MFLADIVTDWEWPGDSPSSYGWYHIMWLVIMVGFCILFGFIARKHDKKRDKWITFGFGLMLLIIETYKQVVNTLIYDRYQWYLFPFVFCSIPLYVALITPWLKEGKAQDSGYKFLAFYALLAGLACMIYPGDVFSTPYITLLIHTMLWHSSLVVLGVYLIISKGYGKNFFKEMLPPFILYLIFVAISIVGNDIGYFYLEDLLTRHNDAFNLLHISYHFDCALPILREIKLVVPYSIFILIYIIAFALGTSAVFFIVKGIKKLVTYKK